MSESSTATVEPTLDEHLAAALPTEPQTDASHRVDDSSRSEDPAGSGRVTTGAVETDEDSGDGSDSDAAASEAGKTLAGRKKTARERIAQLEWEKHEERRRAERLEGEIQALKQPKPPEPVDDKPKLRAYVAKIGTDYETYEDASEAHAEALTDWKLAKERQSTTASEAQRAYHAAVDGLIARGREKHATFVDVLESFGQTQKFTPWMEQAILTDREQGADLAFALASEPESYQALASAPDWMTFTRRLGKLLTRLEAAPTGAPASKTGPQTKAQPPITPTRSSPVTAAESSGDADDLDAHIARENAREARQRAQRR